MKTFLTLLAALFAATALFTGQAEAKRFGGGMSLGKQYKSAPRTPSQPRQSTPSGAQPGAMANPGRTSGASRWLGPLAGLAAGGLLASLLFGDGFEGLQIMDILLFAGLIFGGMMLFRALRARSAPQPAGVGYQSAPPPPPPGHGHMDFPGVSPAMGGTDTNEAPAWFNAAGFADGAKTHFIRLQAAWDKGDFRDIREYTTPELFAELQREHPGAGSDQYTEVLTLNAELLGTRRDGDQLVASVHFTGLLREEHNAEPADVSEIWHVMHGWDSPDGDWLIAGIQQTAG